MGNTTTACIGDIGGLANGIGARISDDTYRPTYGGDPHGSRLTIPDTERRASVQDVKADDMCYVPPGLRHTLQGLGPQGCEFLIVFDDGAASEFNTLLVTDWLAHAPPEILAQNFGVPAQTFRSIALHDLYIFQATAPGPLAVDQAAVASGGVPPDPFTFSLAGAPPRRSNRNGSLLVATARRSRSPKPTAQHWRRSSPAVCERRTGIRTPTNGNSPSRARGA